VLVLLHVVEKPVFHELAVHRYKPLATIGFELLAVVLIEVKAPDAILLADVCYA
jgi:hypothetical protein